MQRIHRTVRFGLRAPAPGAALSSAGEAARSLGPALALALPALFAQGCAGAPDAPDARPAPEQPAAVEAADPGDEDAAAAVSADEPFDPVLYERFLRETATRVPDLTRYQFLGYLRAKNSTVWVHSTPPAATIDELFQANGLRRERADASGDGPDVGRGLLVSADGRVFRERDEPYRARVAAVAAMPPEGRARAAGADHFGGTDVDQATGERPDDGTTAPPPGGPQAVGLTAARPDTIFGGDGRSLVTSSAYPWRALGVAMYKQNGSGWSGLGTATMVGPRAAISVAHTVSDDGQTNNVLALAPAARGPSWCTATAVLDQGNCRFPHRFRAAEWYYWPEQWDGSGMKYEYGIVILNDLNVSPGWVGFGYKSAVALDYATFNSAGYPGRTKACADAFDANGQCGGYMYRQAESTTSVFTNYAYHNFDVQEGQSGASLYQYHSASDERTVYMLHQGSAGPYAYAKRLREGSFNTVCDWVQNWPSSFFSNISC